MLIIDADLYVYKAGFAHRGKEIGFRLVRREPIEITTEQRAVMAFFSDCAVNEIDLGNISLVKAKEHCGINGYSKDEWKLVHYNEPTSLEHTLGNLNQMIETLLDRFGNPEYKMFITASDHSNYRFNIATISPYKGSRSKCIKCFERCKAAFDRDKNVVLTCKNCGTVDKETTVSDKPHYYNEIREHLQRRWGAELITGEEADDAVSILATDLQAAGIDCVMVHIDKDINNTPGKHYNPDKMDEYVVTESEALRNFYSQFLLGDSIDCIPGVPGAGPVATKELLKNCETRAEYEHTIFEIYQGEEPPIKRFKNVMNLTPDEAYARLTEVGQLLHIRQVEEELWKPVI